MINIFHVVKTISIIQLIFRLNKKNLLYKNEKDIAVRIYMDNTELGINVNGDLNEDIYTKLHCTGSN